MSDRTKGKHTEDLVIGIVVFAGGIWGHFSGFNPEISIGFVGVGAFFCGWWFSNWDKYRRKKH